MRALVVIPLLLLPACGDEPEAAREAQPREKAAELPAPELEPPAATPEDREASGDAAGAVRKYYSLIEAGEYDAAWRLRFGESGDEARRRFAANFQAYETYQVDVGTPSEPVQSQGWAFVEVPVMIRGTFRGGKPFASAGSITVRRATSGPEAGSGWHIYTGEARRR